MSSCTDDDLLYERTQYNNVSRAIGEGTNTGGLTQQSDGKWVATRRVPLVGYGRIMNNVSNAVVSVGAIGDECEKIVDLDLNNSYSPGNAVIGADAITGQIASVRDLNHVYAAGQLAGFLIKGDESNVLSLDVLKGFWIDTYLKGEKQDSRSFTESTSLLDLGVGNIATGADKSRVIEIETTKPFDEVRIGVSGVNATVLKSVHIYYAYVGESPVMPAVNDGEYSWFYNSDGKTVSFNNKGSWYSEADQEKLLNTNLDDGIVIETLSSVVGGLVGALTGGKAGPVMTINFGQEIPAGSEVGFYMTSANVLDLSIATGAVLYTLDEYGNDVEQANQVGVLGLKIAGGGAQYFSMITTKDCHQVRLSLFGVDVKVGGQNFHYAYVRERATIDASSYYSATDVTVYNPNYRFPKALQGEVTYTLVSTPTGSSAEIKTVNGETIITGMNITGPYIVNAQYTDSSGNVINQKFTVTRGLNSQVLCDNAALVNKSGESAKYKAVKPDGFDGIQILGFNETEGSMNALVDEDTSNKIIFKTNVGVTIAADKPLVAVETIDKSSIKGSIKNARVGFVVENNTTFLKADVLKFLQIKLLKDGVEVDKHLANGAISVGLIKDNQNNQNLTRLSINTDKDFDRIELYAIQPIAINVATEFGVFYAFCEDEQLECSNPGDDCMQLITNANYGAVPSWKTSGLATIATTVTNLSNIVDSDINSYGTIVSPVDAANAAELSVKFNEIQASEEYPQTVGYIIKNNVNMIALIGVTQLFAYNSAGEEVAAVTSFGTLDVELTNDKTYFPITVTKPFSELRLVKGQGVSVGDGLNVCGLFIKPDIDGDHVLDCVTDDVISGVKNFKIEKADICIGSEPEFSITGAQPDYPFFIRFYEVNSGEKPVFTYRVKSSDDDMTLNSKLVAWDSAEQKAFEDFYTSEANVGRYSVRFFSSEYGTEDDALYMEIHPLQTTWKGTVSSDWTNWNNWDNGEPWSCTNVVIPSPGKLSYENTNYPILAQGNTYCCQNIHFEPGAMLKGQQFLTYSKAYVDVNISGGDYHLMSSPLQAMVTGDMFVNNDWNLNGSFTNGKWNSYDLYFTELNSDNYKEQRINPIVYQRFWDETVTNETMSRSVGNLLSNNFDGAKEWTRSFNAVNSNYQKCQGFAIRIGADGASETYTLHFPKSHTTYNYYDANGNYLKPMQGDIARDSCGRFWPFDKQDNIQSTLHRRSGGTFFLCGNPFMSRINIEIFLKNNTSISAVHKYQNNQYKKMTKGYIEPMEAVFLEAKSTATMLTVHFNYEALDITTSNATN